MKDLIFTNNILVKFMLELNSQFLLLDFFCVELLLNVHYF